MLFKRAIQSSRIVIGQQERQGSRMIAKTMIGKTATLFFSLCLVFVNTSVGEILSIGESRRIHSNQVNEDREYKVYLPGSYRWAQDKRYPVLYLLDGDSHFFHTAAAVDFLSGQGEIPEMIVVAIASTVRVRDFTQTDWSSHWIGGAGA